MVHKLGQESGRCSGALLLVENPNGGPHMTYLGLIFPKLLSHLALSNQTFHPFFICFFFPLLLSNFHTNLHINARLKGLILEIIMAGKD